jgi:hypothetical protein
MQSKQPLLFMSLAMSVLFSVNGTVQKLTCQDYIKVQVTIIYNCRKHYDYLQAHLHQTQTDLQIQKLLKHIEIFTQIQKL